MSAPAVSHEEAVERTARWLRLVAAQKATLSAIGPVQPDPVTRARELYVSGQISLSDFEARIDAILSSA